MRLLLILFAMAMLAGPAQAQESKDSLNRVNRFYYAQKEKMVETFIRGNKVFSQTSSYTVYSQEFSDSLERLIDREIQNVFKHGRRRNVFGTRKKKKIRQAVRAKQQSDIEVVDYLFPKKNEPNDTGIKIDLPPVQSPSDSVIRPVKDLIPDKPIEQTNKKIDRFQPVQINDSVVKTVQITQPPIANRKKPQKKITQKQKPGISILPPLQNPQAKKLPDTSHQSSAKISREVGRRVAPTKPFWLWIILCSLALFMALVFYGLYLGKVQMKKLEDEAQELLGPYVRKRKPQDKKWAILRFRYTTGALMLSYMDGLGKKTGSDEAHLWSDKFSYEELHMPVMLEQYLQELVLWPEEDQNLALAIYIDVIELPRGLMDLFFHEGKKIVKELFPETLLTINFDLAFYNSRTTRSKSFGYPFNIYYQGEIAKRSLKLIKKNGSDESKAIRVSFLMSSGFFFVPRRKVADLLVADWDYMHVSVLTGQILQHSRLCIGVSKGYPNGWQHLVSSRCNALIINHKHEERTAAFISTLITTIIRGYTLQESVNSAKVKNKMDDDEVVLFSSPASNESLQANDYQQEILSRLAREKSSNTGEPGGWSTARRKIILRKIDFSLVLDRDKQRRVRMTLDHLGLRGYKRMDANAIIRRNGRYRLNINIGDSLSGDNLIGGQYPPINTLLSNFPDRKEYYLEVVAFPKDFKLITEAVQTLRFHPNENSKTVQFLLKAPEKRGEASLRVAVFYKNHLLQAFLLTAHVGQHNNVDGEPNIQAALDLSTTKEFSNLDRLKERDQYIGINSNSHGMHSIFLKGSDEEAEEISGLNESVLKEAQEQFRILMEDVYFKKGDPRFPLEHMPGEVEEFEMAVRNLARFGNKYYRQVLVSNKLKVKKMLSTLRKEQNLNIQIGRHEMNHFFPWAVLYDYELPYEITEQLFPVCYGQVIKNPPETAVRNDGSIGCQCNPGLYTYCIHGFWGVRHRLEQLVATDEAADGGEKELHPEMTPILLCNSLTDNHSKEMTKNLKAKHPKMVEADEDSNVIQTIFDPKTRPVNLVVVGHLEKKPIPGEPLDERILTFPRERWSKATPLPKVKWICQDTILAPIYRDQALEKPPLPIAFLISCYNAGMTVDSLASLVKCFRSAGVLAIVGTECDITPDLSAEFVKQIMSYLYDDKVTLGTAIRLFNISMMKARIPLAFSFTCFGNNDITVFNQDL